MSDRRRSRRWIWAWIAVGTPGLAIVGSLLVASRYVPHTTVAHVTFFDVLARPGETVALRVRLRGGLELSDAPGESVVFEWPGAEPVTVLSDEHGIAAVETRFNAPGDHAVRLSLPSRFRESQATAIPDSHIRAFVRTDDTPIALCFVEPALRPSAPWHAEQQVAGPATAPPGSLRALVRIAQAHLIVYITLDTDIRLNATRRWLIENGFPAGPLLGWGDATGTSAIRERIEQLTATWPQIDVALVGQVAAAQALRAVGIRTYLIGGEADPGGSRPDGVTFVPDWAAIDRAVTSTD